MSELRTNRIVPRDGLVSTTTSATTYKLQVRHENGAGNININRINSTDDSAVAGRYSSTITLMEFSV